MIFKVLHSFLKLPPHIKLIKMKESDVHMKLMIIISTEMQDLVSFLLGESCHRDDDVWERKIQKRNKGLMKERIQVVDRKVK